MIISVGAIDMECNKKLLRPSRPLPAANIQQYISEFMASYEGNEGVVEKNSYNYFFTTKGAYVFFIQATKEVSYTKNIDMLKYIAENSDMDIFDILFTIDNLLYQSELIKVDVKEAKTLESQDEKIYNMMLEKKNTEMIMKEKEYIKEKELQKEKELRNIMVNKKEEIPKILEVKSVVKEVSKKPVLILIKEKLKMTIDKENNIKENVVNGELSIVISDVKYTKLELKMKNLKRSLRFSPHLDKESIKKNIIKFLSERTASRNIIPLAKWSDQRRVLPFVLDAWIDEEDGMCVVILTLKARIDLEETEIIFKNDGLIEIEVSGDVTVNKNNISWNIGNLLAKGEKTCEIRYFGKDENALFPASVKFRSYEIESDIDLDCILVKGSAISEYEVRKITEIDNFTILNE